MAEVRSVLELDIADALAQVDVLQTSLTDALTTAADAGSAALGDSLGAAAGGAAEGVTQLGNAAETANTQTTGLKDGVKGLEGAALLATGQVGGMRSVVQGFGADAIPAVAGALALGASIHELFTAGVEAQAAQQRYNATLGDMAARVSQINVGSLNADLKELSISLGSDDEATMNAAASLFQFATNAGMGRKAAADFTDEVIALAARAVALNPALGTIADVIPQLSRGLATGGRFAQRFQLDLNATDITAKAFSMTGKTLASDLSVTEKQAAGAALAVAKYGAQLKGDVKTGTENAIIQQRSLHEQLRNVIEELGKPLVTPIFELMRQAVPTVEALGRVLSEIGTAAIPLVTVALEAITPFLTAFADILTVIGPTALTVVLGLLTLYKTFNAIVSSLAILKVAVMENPLGALAVVAVTIASAFGLLGGSAKEVTVDIKNLGRATDESLKRIAEAIAAQIAQVRELSKDKAVEEQTAVLKSLDEQATQNIETARRFGQALADAGVITEQQFNKAIANASIGQQQLSKDNAASSASLSALVDTAVGKLPTFDSVLQTTKSNLAAFGQSLDSAATPEALLADLQADITAVANFQTNLALLVGRGLTATAQALAAQGPEIGGKTAQAILDGDPKVAAAIELTTKARARQAKDATDVLGRILGKSFDDASGEAGAAAKRSGDQVANHFVNAIHSHIPEAHQVGIDLAQAAARGLNNAGSPTEHLFFDSGALFAQAAMAGWGSVGPSFTAAAAHSAAGSPAASSSVAGVAPASVQVIVVRDGWEARAHLPAGTGQQVDTFLSGR